MLSSISNTFHSISLNPVRMARSLGLNCYFAKLLLVLGSFSLICCHFSSPEEKRNIESFYIPFTPNGEGVVYEYRSLENDQLEPEFWHFRAFDSLGNAFIHSRLLRPDGTLVQESLDQRVENGVIQKSLILYDRDSTGETIPIQVKIESPDLFPFSPTDSIGVTLYRSSYRQPGDSLEITLVRNRRFLHIEDFKVFGKTYKSANFYVKELLKTTREGSTESIWDGEEAYGEGLGLIYFRKQITPDFLLEYGLYKTYSAEDFFKGSE